MWPRILGIWLFCLNLSWCAAYAQEGASPSGPAATSNAPSDAGQPSEVKKTTSSAGDDGTTAEVAHGAVAKDALASSVPPASQAANERFPVPSTEPGQMYFELRYTVDGTDIQGNADRSFLRQGINHTAEISFFDNTPIFGTRRLEILSVGRYTNNTRVDPERNSLQRAYVRLTGPSFEATLGDSLVNYSRLSINQNIRGLNVWKNILPRLKLTGTVGFFTDRWGSVYRNYTYFRDITAPANPLTPAKPYSRLVGGARLEQKFGRSNWLAANWSHGKDLQQSLPEASLACQDQITAIITFRPITTGCLANEVEDVGFRRPASEAINNDVLSADTNLEFAPLRLKMRGEFAYSWTAGGTPPATATATNFLCAAQPPIFGASVLDARCFPGQVSDWAARFEANERIKKFNWRVDYSRFEPDFFSANSRQIRDLQDFSVRGEYELTRQVSVVGSWRRSNDNLNGLRNFTNVVRAPEGRLIFRELPFYRRMTVEVGYKERNLDTEGTPAPTDLQKRSTRIPFISFTLPMGPAQVLFDYEHRHEINAVTPQLSTDTDRFAAGFRSRYNWGGWEFIPSARFEIERLDKNTPINPALSPTDITLLFPGDFLNAYDTNRSIQAGFLLEAPRYFRIEGNYREFNGLAFSAVQATKFLNPQAPFLYFNQGFKRPDWRAAVTYKIGNDENRTITAFYERTNNLFPTGDPFLRDLRSFRETVIGGTIVFRFRR